MADQIRILIILPNNLGDIIMATPVLAGLKEKYPDSHITFFAEKGFEGGLLNNPHIDSLVTFPRPLLRDSFVAGQWCSGSEEFIACINKLSEHEYDTIINLSQHPYISSLIPLFKAKSITGCRFLREGNDAVSDNWSQYLYAIPFARNYNSFHATDVYRRMAGVINHCGNYTIHTTNSEKEEAGNYLQKIGVDTSSKRIIILQPGAAFSAKRWPESHWITLGKLLVQNGWQVVISGAPAETELARRIQERIGDHSFSTAGDTTFRQVVANLNFAHSCVTGDTALMHAAAALKVKTFALFGATNPVETGPYGSGHYIFSGGCNERPCFCDTCKTMLCMKSILSETVYQCIENDSIPSEPRCDIYRTAVQKNGEYRILTTDPVAYSYYNPAGARIVRKAFETDFLMDGYSQEEFDICREESQNFIAIVTVMEELIQIFLKNNEIEKIRNFEKCKNDLSQLTGISCFWSALLNLRLNGIPMLDPGKGVRLSAEACMVTIKQIQSVFSSPQ